MVTIQDMISQQLNSLFSGVGSTPGSNISDYTGQAFQNYAGGTPGTFDGSAGSSLNTGLGLNIGAGQLGLNGLSSLAGIWGAYNSNKLANEQFKFTKDTTNTNLNNQIKSYNTTLTDRINARAAMQGDSQSSVDEYLAKNQLTR